MSQTDVAEAWQAPACHLDEAALRSLMAGQIPAIRIANFASVAECEHLCQAIRGAAHIGQTAVTSPMNLIGCNFSNHGAESKEKYFARVDPSYRDVASLASAGSVDPLGRMTAKLRSVWPASVETAEEPSYGRYFAGGIKTRTAGSELHYDFAPHTAMGYAIGVVLDQLGWNLYLDLPANTGHTITYNHPVPRRAGRQGFGHALSMRLDRAWVDGATSFTFRPEIGEVVIINTRYPHEVVVDNIEPGEWRVQASSFIGRLPNDELILWS